MASEAILTTYLTSKAHPLYGHFVEQDSLTYIEVWYRSMRRLGLHGVIFHDGLSEAFVNRYQTREIRFLYENPQTFAYSVNDQRFFIYRRYLEDHPEIVRVFMTDANDVTVIQAPFPHLEPRKLYVGNQPGCLYPPEPMGDNYESMSYEFIKKQLATAGDSYLELLGDLASSDRDSFPVLNAGILGGCREIMLEFLDSLTEELRAVGKPEENLNMSLLNHVLYRKFPRAVVTGAPIHSQFGGYETHRRDVWFVHK